MRTRSLLLVPALALSMLLAGCGGSDDGEPADDASAATTSAAPTPTPTPTPTRTKKPRPTRSAPTVAPEGDGDGEDDGRPATEGGGICSDLDADEVGAVLRGTVTGEALPGGGCVFTQRNPRSPSASVVETSFAKTPGGMAGAKDNATSAVEGTPQDLAGLGDGAFVVTGTAFGGPDLQGAGAVRVGDRLVSVLLSQSAGMPRGQVRALVVSLLNEIADELD